MKIILRLHYLMLFIFISLCAQQSFAACMDQNNKPVNARASLPVVSITLPSIVYSGTDYEQDKFMDSETDVVKVVTSADLRNITCDKPWTIKIVPLAGKESPSHNLETSVVGAEIKFDIELSNMDISFNNPQGFPADYSKPVNFTSVRANLVKVNTGTTRRSNGVIPAENLAELDIIEDDGTKTELAKIALHNQVTVNIGDCKISNLNPKIDLGSYLAQDFHHAGTVTSNVNFSISAQCDPRIHVYGQFTGKTTKDNEVFGIDSGSGSASGVGIQLRSFGIASHPSTTPIAIQNHSANDQFLFDAPTRTVGVGVLQMLFQANYYQLDNTVTPGAANATINFVIKYD